MGIFDSIKAKIFGAKPAEPAVAMPTAPTTASAAAPAPSPASAETVVATPAAAAMALVDVAAQLTTMAKASKQTLDWHKSIVDLLKLLDLDSSLEARKELAKELNYTGSTSDSAAMNIWLHKAVMQKLAANGGKVPDDLKN